MKSDRIITVTGIVVCAIVEILLVGFLFSILKTSGFWLLPGFGLLGIVVFLQSFPLFPLTVIILLTIVLVFLLRQFVPFRRHSFFITSLALLILALFCGFLVSLLPAFSRLQPPPPPKNDHVAESLLRGYGAWRFHNVFRGTITGVGERSYVLRSPGDRLISVELTPGTHLPSESQIGSGDTVLIIGEVRGGTIRAFGIRKL